jgi:hypothetical protein
MTASAPDSRYTLKEKLRDAALVWLALALLAAISVSSDMNRFYAPGDVPVVEVFTRAATTGTYREREN